MIPKQSNDEYENWKRWKDGRDPVAGNYLVSKYLFLVDYVAGRLMATLPDKITKEELRSLGMEGLLDALDKFDPERGLKFETYATLRIKGAIIDGLRKGDVLPRSLREKARKIEEAYLKLEQEKLRSVSDEEVGAYLGISVEELRQTLFDISVSAMVSINETVQDDDNQTTIRWSVLENPHAENPEKRLDEMELKEVLAEAISKLPEKEKWVVSMVYFEELTLTEISKILNLSTSRISQLHSKALLRLKAALEKEKTIIHHF
jgi:RNA polymerase sigma factor for flagellar operon FliA